MDGCGLIFGLAILAFIIALPISMARMREKAREHTRMASRLADTYDWAKQQKDFHRFVQAARAVITEFQANNTTGLPEASHRIYRDVLGLLNEMPQLRPFALEVGRVAYGSRRENKNPTVYDEQAIMNDINAHL